MVRSIFHVILWEIPVARSIFKGKINLLEIELSMEALLNGLRIDLKLETGQFLRKIMLLMDKMWGHTLAS